MRKAPSTTTITLDRTPDLRDTGSERFRDQYTLELDALVKLAEPPINERGWHDNQHVAIEFSGGTLWISLMDLKDHFSIDVQLFRDQKNPSGDAEDEPLGVFGMSKERGRVDFGEPEPGDLMANGHRAAKLVVLLAEHEDG